MSWYGPRAPKCRPPAAARDYQTIYRWITVTQQTDEHDRDVLDPIKRAARAQWGHDPAGGLAADSEPLGTPESFARVEVYRYAEQPWMHATFGYDRWAGKDVLEVGVGLGTDHLQFARAGARMSGIDLTPICVEMTERRLDQEGFASRLSVMDAERLDFPNDSFDVVYSFGVLHHTTSPELAFREIRRVLRPGGEFIGGLYSKPSWFCLQIRVEQMLWFGFLCESWADRRSRIEQSTSDAKPHVRLFTPRELRATLRDAGLRSSRCQKATRGPRMAQRAAARLVGDLDGWYLIDEAR